VGRFARAVDAFEGDESAAHAVILWLCYSVDGLARWPR
jgi:hypothetical protein